MIKKNIKYLTLKIKHRNFLVRIHRKLVLSLTREKFLTQLIQQYSKPLTKYFLLIYLIFIKFIKKPREISTNEKWGQALGATLDKFSAYKQALAKAKIQQMMLDVEFGPDYSADRTANTYSVLNFPTLLHFILMLRSKFSNMQSE